MSMWQITPARRTVAAASLAAALALTLSACGDDPAKTETQIPSSSQQHTSDQGGGERARQPEQPADDTVIATLQGPQGITLDVTSATRDSSGFVTVNGNLKNSSDEDFTDTAQWTGPELAMKRAAGDSLGGATLVDKAEKKRYYTLRDTENRPLATTGLGIVAANSDQKVFMQFPAPPKSTTDVDLQIPTFQAVSLTLTDA
ncbi:hypothetical protein [Streptomyces ochraceiscleroticus]|uniref:Secreted protein n=1 Tax=Streptomyces ochraceiscleroticus TaxID=47761 RepID=A0ABW1MFN7_9ACTN|nr:hypothetical protein [Streptomyces ochraceiscleroticus]